MNNYITNMKLYINNTYKITINDNAAVHDLYLKVEDIGLNEPLLSHNSYPLFNKALLLKNANIVDGDNILAEELHDVRFYQDNRNIYIADAELGIVVRIRYTIYPPRAKVFSGDLYGESKYKENDKEGVLEVATSGRKIYGPQVLGPYLPLCVTSREIVNLLDRYPQLTMVGYQS